MAAEGPPTNEVLDIARIETRRISLSVEPIVLAEALWEAIDLINPLAASQGIELKAEDAWPADRFVRADRQRLWQVLLNLLSNAVKYNRPGGVVTVRCTEVSMDWVRIEVTDQGQGIPPEVMDRLFVPHRRRRKSATSLRTCPRGSSGGPHTLLYVEDNTANLKLIERALRRRPDVTLLSAAQGTLGLDLARQHQPDLVLLDLHLPGHFRG